MVQSSAIHLPPSTAIRCHASVASSVVMDQGWVHHGVIMGRFARMKLSIDTSHRKKYHRVFDKMPKVLWMTLSNSWVTHVTDGPLLHEYRHLGCLNRWSFKSQPPIEKNSEHKSHADSVSLYAQYADLANLH